MEWKKVRGWLLVLLLAADLILAGNLLLQGLEARQTLRQAAEDAVTIAANRGLALELETVLQLPRQLSAYSALRSDVLEKNTADVLLGGEAVQEAPGGGVAIYRNEKGSVSFRRGGDIEADAPWTWDGFDALQCAEALEYAGLPMEDVLLEQQNGSVQLTQSFDDYPVFNSQLQCVSENGRLQVHGRWLLAETASAEGQSLSRAQMVLELCELAEMLEIRQVNDLRAGYYLQSEDAQSLALVPVWSVQTEQGQLLISCLTGEQVIY